MVGIARVVARATTLVCAAIVSGACRGDTPPDSAASLDFPPAPPPAVGTVSAEDFVGAEACASCHEDQYQAWATSTHGQAGGTPGPDVVIAPFDGRAIRFADATVTPRVRGGTWEFVVRQDGFDDAVFRVDGVIGGAHMIGGGTQGFITRRDDGTERFLPWDWSGASSEWFCNTGSRANQGWVPVTEEMSLADCGDWPPLRPVGTVDRFANCQECHGSQIVTELEPGSGFSTEYTTLQINCESCHGPARRHVELAEAERPPDDGDLGIGSLAYRGKDEALSVCLQCHALKDVLKEGYLPGQPLEEYYALKYPVLGDQPYSADGRVRSFAYQANHLASACYLQGPMECASCHEPHSQGYWDIDQNPLPDPFADGQCTSCHPSKMLDVERHTFHPAESEGSTCVSCHMPYLQHPEVGDEIAFARSDHTIAIPRPVFDADVGIDGACAQCHDDRSSLQLQSQVSAWWGELKPHRPLVAGIAGEFRARNVSEAADLLIHPDQTDPFIQFQALSRLLTAYLKANALDLPANVEAGLLALTESDDLDVRSLALASLHWVRGDDPAVRGRLVEALATAPDDEPLRGRWLLALGFLGDRARDEGDFATSLVAYEKALELRPGDARVLHALGQMHNRAGSWPLAIDALRSSLAADREQPLAWVNLGIALAGSGDPAGAREAYEEALRLNPYEALAHFNLGNTYQLAERYEDAAASYARAVAADPGLGLGHFELGRTYIRLERFDEALPHARRAVEFMPEHQGSRQMLADLERALGA
jgi:tetratricopeptide (TPR) repeat protein